MRYLLASEVIQVFAQEFSMGGRQPVRKLALDKEIQRAGRLDREEIIAIEKGVNLIIVKHAPIFRPIKDLHSHPQPDLADSSL